MKKTTRKQLEEIGEMWLNRGRKLGEFYSNNDNDPIKKAQALKLMSELSRRITKIGLALMPKPPKNLKGESAIININGNKHGGPLIKL